MAKWIWCSTGEKIDQYVEFVSDFSSTNKKVSLKISADTDYMVYVNNKLVAFGQYKFYPDHPVYELVSIPTKIGNNKLKIIVYHNGEATFSTYHKGLGGLYFEIRDGEKLLLESNKNILSSESKLYESGHKKLITFQLDYVMFMDLSKANAKLDFNESIEIEKSYNFRPRENNKVKVLKRCDVDVSKVSKGHYLIDLGKETVGYLDLDFVSPNKQNIEVHWGEHIADGGVRYQTSNRTFATYLKAKKGHNKLFNTFRRYGLRYLEIFASEDIDINYIGIRPCVYPFKEKHYVLDSDLHQRIYDTSVETLKCCYHDHFEDCPWREQALYTMDSRNQILFHLVAFKNLETIRSSLRLMVEDNREDSQLSITFPTSVDYVIPSYCFYLIDEYLIYYQHSKDIETLRFGYPKLKSVIGCFISKSNGKLVDNSSASCYWSFYEWVDGLFNTNSKNDSIFNLLFVLALQNMAKINKILGIDEDYKVLISKLKKNINKYFYDKDKGLYIFSKENPRNYALANSLAILTKTSNKKCSIVIADKLINDKDIVPSSIALRYFTYDALLMVDKAKYKDYILNDIDTMFKKQLDAGATTFWETELGESDFSNAGSLCHAWSALAIYYYKKFDLLKKKI